MTPLTRQQALDSLTSPGQPYTLAEQVIAGRTLRVFVNAPTSLRAVFEATATNLPFLVYQDERWTFAQAWADAARIGQVLVHTCGVLPGDRVAIALRNYPEWVLAFTAITSIGAVAVAMNGHWLADELAYGLQDSGASVVLADSERLDRLAQAAVTDTAVSKLQVLAVRPSRPLPPNLTVQRLQDLTDAIGKAGAVPMPAVQIAPDAQAIILYTSGSTGHPKGVVSTHRQILSALLSWELDRAASELMARSAGTLAPAAQPDAVQPGTLLAVPLFHVSGLHVSCLSSYRMQRRTVAMYRWDPDLAATLIAQEQLDSVLAPAAMTGDLVRVAKAGQHDLRSLTVVGGGGAPRAPEQVRQIDTAFPNAMPGTGWGMTETNGIGTGIFGDDYLGRPASSGRCSAVLQLRVVDESGRALPAGERGELLVRGTSVFNGYWNQPEVNAQAFVDDWFRTGDVAYLDDEGFLFIVDRIKDLIIRGGENIGCGQVEAALLLHPDVLEAAVYAVPDERLGEVVGATVYGSAALDAAALQAFLPLHLAAFELPTHLRISSTPLPRTPSGKILKRQVKDAALVSLQR